MTALELVLMLLAAAVVTVVVFRLLSLPPVIGYLLVGVLIGPHALRLINDTESTAYLAEFGVVFMMFTIGLEFSLPRLFSMKRLVFGLGLAQTVLTMAVLGLMGVGLSLGWSASLVIGAVLTMSSTAVLSKLLADRLELDSKHGREVIGVLLFQDLAVVPLLVLIPALSLGANSMVQQLAVAGVKAVVALALILWLGPNLMQRWFYMVAKRRSPELFVLNVLFITLGLAWVTQQAGLSLALGAFLAGMLISETDYRYQVEEDIKPFRDVLMGLFFVTVGMLLDVRAVAQDFGWVMAVLAVMLLVKFFIIAGLSRMLGSSQGTAMRVGLWLCAGGEFGFVLLNLADTAGVVQGKPLQIVLAALVLSMLLAPFLAHYADKIVLRLVPSEWLARSMQLTSIAAQSMGVSRHAILCGFGRNGQYMSRLLEQEGITYFALDLDPERVRDASAAGETVVYGDAAKRETLMAAGIMRASVVVITYADTHAALRVISAVQAIRPDMPIVVRTSSEADMEKLMVAGATEVVPESLESAIMLASHALVLLGVPLNRVLKRIRQIRGKRYQLLRGLYRGADDLAQEAADEVHETRLHSVVLKPRAHAIGKTLAEMNLEQLDVEVTAIRRRKIRVHEPDGQTRFEEDDVVVLMGEPAGLAAAEARLLKNV